MKQILCGLIAAATILAGGCAAAPSAASVVPPAPASTVPTPTPEPSPSATATAEASAAAAAASLARAAAKPRAVITKKKPYVKRVKVGTSVKGRTIYAYQVGDPKAKKVALVIGQLHGDEKAGVKTAKALINDKRTVKGIQLWVIPTMNPDGNAASTRKNANGVDLNRNWPVGWQRTSSSLRYFGGSKPLNQPETKAVKKFIKKYKPTWVVGLHQPLGGVDSDGVKDWKLQKALVKHMRLPSKAFTCSSKCGGTMTMWVNDATNGAMVTVEYWPTVSNTYAKKTARDGLVKALGGRY